MKVSGRKGSPFSLIKKCLPSRRWLEIRSVSSVQNKGRTPRSFSIVLSQLAARTPTTGRDSSRWCVVVSFGRRARAGVAIERAHHLCEGFSLDVGLYHF